MSVTTLLRLTLRYRHRLLSPIATRCTKWSTAKPWSCRRWGPTRPGSRQCSTCPWERSQRRKGWGATAVEMLFRIDPAANLQRRPDLAFVSYERWPRGKRVPDGRGVGRRPRSRDRGGEPDQPGRGPACQGRRIFPSGGAQVWVIYPSAAQVHVHESTTHIRVLGRGDELDGGPLLPGFRLPLAELFEGRGRARLTHGSRASPHRACLDILGMRRHAGNRPEAAGRGRTIRRDCACRRPTDAEPLPRRGRGRRRAGGGVPPAPRRDRQGDHRPGRRWSSSC